MPSDTPLRHSSKGGLGRRRRRRSRRAARRRLKAAIAALVLAGLGFTGYLLWERGMFPANQAAEDWYEVSNRDKVLVELPRDDAPHDDYMEWWYYNGHLESETGDRYSFHFVVFAINALATHSVAHVSFLDQQTGRYHKAQKRTSGNSSRHTKDGFDFMLGDWQMSGGNGQDRIRAGTDEFRFDLRLNETVPPVMHGGTGLLDFELAGKSYYYTRPRMSIEGLVKLEAGLVRVTGLAWFDHQWGDFEVNKLGWDWFALQLDDGTDIMIYLLFDSGGLPVLSSATLSRGGPESRELTEADFEVEVTDRWISSRTGIDYPMGWIVRIPELSMELEISPIVRDAEFDARTTSYKVYWEGPVEVTGSHPGRGFVEMSGHAKASS